MHHSSHLHTRHDRQFPSFHNKMLYLVCCALHFFGARNPEVHYYFQRQYVLPQKSGKNLTTDIHPKS